MSNLVTVIKKSLCDSYPFGPDLTIDDGSVLNCTIMG